MYAYRSPFHRRRLSRVVRRIARVTFVVGWVVGFAALIGVGLVGDEADGSGLGRISAGMLVLVALPTSIVGDLDFDFGSLLVIVIGTIPLMLIVAPPLLVWCLISPFKARGVSSICVRGVRRVFHVSNAIWAETGAQYGDSADRGS